ncbi:hypothetical protein Y032_0205g1908 [Ancylostoma ceylanicum]|nr:hypothetical protein Y032_0205g1908 [Ancylostoma ceylanicum]
MEHWNTRGSEYCWKANNALTLSSRITSIAIALAVVVVAALSYGFETVSSKWSCLGRFTTNTIDLWLPLILMNMCSAMAACSFSYEGLFIIFQLPQYREKLNIDSNSITAVETALIRKCRLNIAFTAIGPWLLVGVWLTTAISSDWTTCSIVNSIAVVVSTAYTACKIMQSILTTPYLYSTMIWKAMRFLPESLSPDFDPETLWSRAEVLEWYRMGNQEAQKNENCRASHIPHLARERLSTLWMSIYAKMRITSERNGKIETIYELYNHKITNNFGEYVGLRYKLRCLFIRWAIRTHKNDPQPEAVRTDDSEASNNLLESVFSKRNCHLDDFHRVWETLKILQPPKQWKRDPHDIYRDTLQGYLRFLEYDPFQNCLISRADRYGNTSRSQFLRRPVNVIKSEVLDNLHGMSTGATGGEKLQKR